MHFGHPVPLENEQPHVRQWGARAIFQRGEIDLVHNRQDFSGPLEDEAGNEAFVKWINQRALPWLREQARNIGSDDPQELVLHEYKYEMRASTHASFGYFYIGAAELTPQECEPRKNTATGEDERVVSVRGVKLVVDKDVPVGTEGVINVNGIGPARTMGYHHGNYDGEIKLLCLMVLILDPPDWWVSQHQNDEAAKLVKQGELPAKRGTKPENGVASPSALKEWKRKWKPKPCPFWANDFKEPAADVA